MPPTPCSAEETSYERASREERNAWNDQEAAMDKWQDELSLLDESTWASLGAAGAAGAACLAATAGVCALGLLFGGIIILGSEQDRWSEIKDAEDAWRTAFRDWKDAADDKLDASMARLHCKLHSALTD